MGGHVRQHVRLNHPEIRSFLRVSQFSHTFAGTDGGRCDRCAQSSTGLGASVGATDASSSRAPERITRSEEWVHYHLQWYDRLCGAGPRMAWRDNCDVAVFAKRSVWS